MNEPGDAPDDVESGEPATRMDGGIGCGCSAAFGSIALFTLGALEIVRHWRGERVLLTDPVVLVQMASVLAACVLFLLVLMWGAFLFLDSIVLKRSYAAVLPAARLAGLLGLVAAVGAAGLYGRGAAQRLAFDRAEEAAVRIHAAIEAFREQHGVPPATLDDLVPDQLERVPPTTLASAPTFEYEPDRRGGTLFIRWGSDRYEF
ncbi:MAG: hypothetical protein AAF726_02740 [Planctomycetota bacterium]